MDMTRDILLAESDVDPEQLRTGLGWSSVKQKSKAPVATTTTCQRQGQKSFREMLLQPTTEHVLPLSPKQKCQGTVLFFGLGRTNLLAATSDRPEFLTPPHRPKVYKSADAFKHLLTPDAACKLAHADQFVAGHYHRQQLDGGRHM